MVFNRLFDRIPGSRFLDIFAGSGAMGLEALSRGARFVGFLERDPELAAAIAKTLVRFQAETEGEVRCASADAVAKYFTEENGWDIIFLDPPYEDNPKSALSPAAGLLRQNGVLILEHGFKTLPPVVGGTRLVDDRECGDSAFAFYLKTEPGIVWE